MYSRPFVVQDAPQPAAPDAITIPEEPQPRPQDVQVEQPPLILPNQQELAKEAAAKAAPPAIEATAPLVRSLSEPALQATSRQPVDLVESDLDPLQPSTSNREHVDVIQEWTEEKQDFMVAMFPTLCPD